VAFGGRRVLSGLDAAFEAPGLVSIMGPSGSGKTTLLGVIAGSVRVAPGTVTMDRRPGPPEDREWIVQSTPLLGRRTVLENVALGPRSRGVAREAAHRIAAESIVDLGIGGLAHQRVYKVSGGERQRVAVARSLAGGPRLILADEPTASLDPHSRELVCRALRNAARTGALVLVATHDPYVQVQAQIAYRLEDGRLSLAV
jgi:ABC-type lipoprotein export system ATPase subunit